MKLPPILHLEDDDNDVLFLEFACREAAIEHPLKTVRDGDDAIAYLAGLGPYADRSRHPLPIMAILDVKAPGKTGHEVLRWIRNESPVRSLVVIMLTASANQSDVNAAYAAGANAFLVKPAGVEKLTDIMRAVRSFWLVHNKFSGDVASVV